MNFKLQSKHLQIEQTNSRIFVVVAVATVISVFSLVSAKTLLSQINHQRHVVSARSAAVEQLEKNIKTAKTLDSFFEVFNNSNPNIIGGIANNNSSGPSDGDNARITLDALPSIYDYPALLTSLEKIMKNGQLANISVDGTDQSDTMDNKASAEPKPVPIEVTIKGTGSYGAIQNVIKDLERSIRPFDITLLTLTGDESKLEMTAKAVTYYQQAKSLESSTKEVK